MAFCFADHRGMTFNWYEDGLHYTGVMRDKTAEEKGLVLHWTLALSDLPHTPLHVDNAGKVVREQVP